MEGKLSHSSPILICQRRCRHYRPRFSMKGKLSHSSPILVCHGSCHRSRFWFSMKGKLSHSSPILICHGSCPHSRSRFSMEGRFSHSSPILEEGRVFLTYTLTDHGGRSKVKILISLQSNFDLGYSNQWTKNRAKELEMKVCIPN